MKKKIALLHYSYPPVIGGVEFVAQAHASLFANDGHQVKVITGTGKSTHPRVKVSIVEEMKAGAALNRRVTAQLAEGNVTTDFEKLRGILYKKLKARIQDQDVCILHNVMTMHFNLPLVAALHSLLDELGKRVRFIIWCHDSTLLNPSYTVKNPAKRPWSLLKTYNRNARYVVISELRKKQFAEIFAVSSKKLRVIPNGVNLKTLLNIEDTMWKMALDEGVLASDIVALLPSRILPRKNIELGIEITASLKRKKIKVKYLITGAPDFHNPQNAAYFRKLKRLKQARRVEKEVVFLHDLKTRYGKDFTIDDEQLRSLYALSDILLLTSVQEGFGIPLIEAGAFKLPAACTNAPPLPEVIGKDGLMFAIDEKPGDIAEKIVRFLSRQPSYRMGLKVKKDYLWDSIYKNHIRKLLS